MQNMRLSVNIHILSSCAFNSVQGRAVSSTATVQVTVLDVNDNPPSFTKPLLTFGVASTADTGHVIVNLQVCLVWLKMFNAGLPPRSRVPGEIKRREVELDPQPRRGHEQGSGAGLRKLDFFRFGLFLNSSATDIVLVTQPSTAVETAVARCTSCCAMARGHRLNTSIVLAAVHGLSGLFRAVFAVEPSLFRPPPSPVPVPNKHPRFCGRKAKWTQLNK